jgi:hypothetical protein
MTTEFKSINKPSLELSSQVVDGINVCVKNSYKISYKRPSTANKRLYRSILRAIFPPVYHGIVAVLANYETESIRPYDIHERVKTWLQHNVNQNVTTSYKYIGVALATLKLIKRKEKAGGKVVLYSLKRSLILEYWNILSTDASFKPLLSTLQAAEYKREKIDGLLSEINKVPGYSQNVERSKKIDMLQDILDELGWLVDVSDLRERVKSIK